MSGLRNISAYDARKEISKEDRARGLWINDHLVADIDDALVYHLTINTDELSIDDAASFVGCYIKKRFPPLM
ncbi:MAG: hypothetical protein CMI18_01315 [Opitutaceae bacterium]|nr:hypothetical protein [Opitutaceae bacterium]